MNCSFCGLVSHSVGAHTALLKPDEDSNSDSSEDEHEHPPTSTATATVSNASTADDCCEECLL